MSLSYFMKAVFKNYGSVKFNDDGFLTIVAGSAFLIASLSRFFWGTLQDYVGFKVVYWAIIGIQVLVSFTIETLSYSKVFYFIEIMLIFTCEGGHYIIFPSLIVNLYGPTLGSKVYAYLFIAMGISACLGIFVSLVILPAYGWTWVYQVFGILTLISAALLT